MSHADIILKLMTQHSWILAYGESNIGGKRSIILGVTNEKHVIPGVIPSEINGMPVTIRELGRYVPPSQSEDMDMFDG